MRVGCAFLPRGCTWPAQILLLSNAHLSSSKCQICLRAVLAYKEQGKRSTKEAQVGTGGDKALFQ